jgi:hypothetical protein
LRTYLFLTLILLLTAKLSIADEPQANPKLLGFSNARETGRTNSRYLTRSDKAVEATAEVKSNEREYQEQVEPILSRSCLPCHGPSRTEGRLRVDQLSADLIDGKDTERWREIYNAVSNSAMPPEDAPDCQLADEDRERIVDWISDEMAKASRADRNRGEHSSFRRLTKYEFRYSLEDLLGVSLPVSNRLPPEVASEDGFKNSSSLLQMSAMQFETYREIGLDALHRAIVLGDRPETVRYRALMSEQIERPSKRKKEEFFGRDDKDYERKRVGRVLLDQQTGEGIGFQEGSLKPLDPASSDSQNIPGGDKSAELVQQPLDPIVLVLPASNEAKWNLDRFLPDSGTMRVIIRVARSNANQEQHASLRLIFSAHTSNDANFSQVISQQDIPVTASPDNPQEVVFDIQLQDIQRNPFRKLTTTFPRRDEFLSIRNVSNAQGKDEPLCLLIDRIEITAPYFDQWPPKSHTDIFLESANANDESVYAREVLSKFLSKAWRRPVSKEEIEPYLELLKEYRTELPNFHTAMVEVLATALASPEFLYITVRHTEHASPSTRARIDDFELASRLSYFLWSSLPDSTLFDLATQGRLSDPKILVAQVDRMLGDPRSKRFSENFVQQWLGTDGLLSVPHIDDPMLRESMRKEPIAFFEEVLRSNSSAMDFVHSDYVVVNETLAQHYGIPNVYGSDFRKVETSADLKRGGILTHAAILAMNSDGKDSHPLKRGVWMLKRILQDPPPPPPPNVPEVDLTDPEIMKMTLKERIADHRNKAACRSCHAKIDPWGIAFENYDALGKFRTVIKDRPVDASSLLYNKEELSGMDGLKEYLLINRQDQLSRAIVDKVMAYGLGRPMTFSDRAQIDQLAMQWRKQEDRMRDLLKIIVTSELFQSK